MIFEKATDIAEYIPKEYELISAENLKSVNSSAAILRHRASGARLAVFANDDTNKLFLAGFRTPPEDDCGTPHIIEHSVLCGSERYPVKDPFMQLVGSSMQTFLNAMTYPDKTVYPVSSCNDTDFKNLMNVYLDAVFAPLIEKRREIFMQEGWHYEITDDGIGVGGVVYSEMLGAVSTPDTNIFDEIIYALYPDGVYANNSGGDPDAILTLTYEDFIDYYRRHYCASNSYIVLYGDIDIRERLEYIDREYLSKCNGDTDVTSRDCDIPLGDGALSYRNVSYPTPVGDETDGKTYFAYGTAYTDSCDAAECFALDILTDILIDSPASPVRRALNDAGIGSEIYGEFINHIRRPAVTVVAKNANESDGDRFYEIIKETLEREAEKGINRKSLRAAIELSEFHFREGEQTSASRGLSLALSMMQSWMYTDEDPFRYLRIDEIFSELRAWLDTDKYESLVRGMINSDRQALVRLSPEAGMNERHAAELSAALENYRSGLREKEYEALKNEYEAFTEYQNREESEEELACVPHLMRSDIALDVQPLFNEEFTFAGIPAVRHRIPTDSLVYLRYMFDISDLPRDMLPYVDLLTDVLGKTDTENIPLEELQDEVRLAAGSMSFGPAIYRLSGDIGSFRHIYEVCIRMLPDKDDRVTELLSEILTKTVFSDKKRIREILSETVSEKQRDIVSSGSEYASGRCLAYHSAADATDDMTTGISSYLAQVTLLENFDVRFDEISDTLENLTHLIFDKKRCMISIAADDADISHLEASCARLIYDLPDDYVKSNRTSFVLGALCEGFMTPSKVQYVTQSGNLYDAGYEYNGAYQVLSTVLKNDFLYPEIRMKGGAYGYSFAVSRISGNVVMTTYRDPALAESLDVFAGIGDYVRSLELSEDELCRAVIGTIGKADRPLSPYRKVTRSLGAYISGITEADTARQRREILEASLDDLTSTADALDAVLNQKYICVIGNEQKISDNSHIFKNTVRLP